jgi:hypothetical protein
MFQGELDKVGRSAIGARECRHHNDCEDDKRQNRPFGLPVQTAAALSLCGRMFAIMATPRIGNSYSLSANHAAQAERRRGSGLRYRSLRLSPHAKVRRKASAKSGERSPRFFMSALVSSTILPVEVKA